ncbi:D site-binding protein [Lingula anatina]|uniref:D site-binding protein n=1 Tax=Lingula anatina TaxID=7574 RepID=A0A1S3IQJ2_LINAN|nr:D site-binding protein [Lingula anatina]|eukprot:XP_013400338.1 D site-binding protein [Lingula anatina]
MPAITTVSMRGNMDGQEHIHGVPAEIKQEPPSALDQTTIQSDIYNGITNGHADDEADEGPLDFSMKKRHQEEEIEDIACNIKKEPQENGISGEENCASVYSTDSEYHSVLGQPQTALPGTVPVTGYPAFHGFPGRFPVNGFPPNMMLPGSPLCVPDAVIEGSKSSRPFKSYPKDPLSLPLGYYGIPGMNGAPPGLEGITATSEELFRLYRNSVLQRKIDDEDDHESGDKPPPSSPTSSISSTSSSPHLPINATHNNRKKPRTLPEGQKDQAYWERRRKNNEAAKRSRDARRAKEDEIAIRAAFLEQENLKLRVEVASLKNETAKLRCMLYNS